MNVILIWWCHSVFDMDTKLTVCTYLYLPWINLILIIIIIILNKLLASTCIQCKLLSFLPLFSPLPNIYQVPEKCRQALREYVFVVFSALVFKEMSEQLVCQPHKSKCKWIIGPRIETWVTVTAGMLLQWVPGNSYTSQTHTCQLSWESSDFLSPHQSNFSCISSYFRMDFEIEKLLHKTSQSTPTWAI